MRTRTFSFLLLLALAGAGHADEPAATRIAVVQLDSARVGDFAAMLAHAMNAKELGADIVVFPEESVLGWLNPRVFHDAQPIPGPNSDAFAAIARQAGIWVAAGLSERGAQVASAPDTFEAFDSGILLDPGGRIVLHHRKHNVLKNAFTECPSQSGGAGCSYTPGSPDDTRVAETPFGRIGMLVCADAYTYDTVSLDALKAKQPELVIIPWGITAGSAEECGKDGFNATGYAAQAAAYLGSAYVVGANAVGSRPYGRFLPSWYCGTSGYAAPSGEIGFVADAVQEIAVFDVPLGGR